MEDIFIKMIQLVKELAEVTGANWYDSGFMTVDGRTASGKNLSLTLNVKEDGEDAAKLE